MSGFYTANWEEYHTEVLRTCIKGIGLTECQLALMGVMLLQAITYGAYSQFTMRQLGMFILPSVDENKVQGKIQHLLNSTSIIKNGDEQAIQRVFEKVHNLAELRVSQIIVVITCIPLLLAIIDQIGNVIKKSKHSTYHIMAGLWPIIIMTTFVLSAFTFSTEAWNSPALVIFTAGPFFCLCCTRIIIASVSKTQFSLTYDKHLTIPILLATIIFPLNSLYLGIQNEFAIYMVMIGLGLVAYFQYTINTIQQITEYLDIYCLTIKPKKVKPA